MWNGKITLTNFSKPYRATQGVIAKEWRNLLSILSIFETGSYYMTLAVLELTIGQAGLKVRDEPTSAFWVVVFKPPHPTELHSLNCWEPLLQRKFLELNTNRTLFILESALTNQGWKSHTALVVSPLLSCCVGSGSVYSTSWYSWCWMLCPLNWGLPGSPISTRVP